MSNAIILLSGGLDSATCLAIAKSQGFTCHALSFQYGQRHAAELDAADRLAKLLGAVEHKTIEIDLRAFGGSALTDDIAVPKDRDLSQPESNIPVTYVPARNTIFLSFALAYAEVRQARDIFIGVNALDYSGYPDCRPEFIEAFARMATLATKAGVEGEAPYRFHTPLISMTKAEIIQTGHALGLDYGQTISCYDADESGAACGTCDSCLLRRKGFQEAGLPDPTRYR
ncbi:7-cyano-7-deazaguanine synthase QueC [Govanella unica]|uniref:7-cyano-7-deazaguanine synthase n=1 Tax=Govanella unica TaxID=2975056 RepID=A0A9X3TZ45_9PROT|nr:7-cyano-7-deazaguanine synthase QueC [Govania unica]MDA5194303.1 7-cyano-7-deazaguanine synthase QueC [Govania unica]